MAKLSFEKIVQKVDHRWRFPLGQKEDMTRPVIGGRAGEPFFHFPNHVLVPSASAKNLCLVFICQKGHLGDKNGSRVFGLGWVDERSIPCLE
jgi:hypothetical protein